MAFLRRSKEPRESTVGLFFATDLHGSDYCFRKFLNARVAYGADVLILGGDITGKLAVPIVDNDDGTYLAYPPGGAQSVNAKQLVDLDAQLRKAGYYPFRVSDPAELDEFRGNPGQVEEKYHELMKARLTQWSAWAEAKLADTDTEIIVAPGNDDPYFLDDFLRELPRFRLVENSVVADAIPGLDLELVSTGVSNPTPWRTHRELSEPDLREQLEELVAGVRDRDRAIFNLHVPPYGSTLDQGPIIDPDNLKKATGFGQDASVPVGSTAVRDVIEEYQPCLSLHGHIHESRGVTRIGRTLAINPGSDYSDGILRGAFVEMTADGPTNYQLTSG